MPIAEAGRSLAKDPSNTVKHGANTSAAGADGISSTTSTHDAETNRAEAAKGLEAKDIRDVSRAVPDFKPVEKIADLDAVLNGLEVPKKVRKRIEKVMKALGSEQEHDRANGEFAHFHIAISPKPTEDKPDNTEVKLVADLGKNAGPLIDKHGFGYLMGGWITNLFKTVDARTMTKYHETAILPQDPDNAEAEIEPSLKAYRQGVEEGRLTSSLIFDLSEDSETKLKPIAVQVYDNMRSQIDQMKKMLEELKADDPKSPMAKMLEAELKQELQAGMNSVVIAGTTFLAPQIAENFVGPQNLGAREELQASLAETMSQNTIAVIPAPIFAPEDSKTHNHVYHKLKLSALEIVKGEHKIHETDATIVVNKRKATDRLPAEHLAQFFAAHMMMEAGIGPNDMNSDLQQEFMRLVSKNTAAINALNDRIAPEEQKTTSANEAEPQTKDS